jgi:hypothetical protein
LVDPYGSVQESGFVHSKKRASARSEWDVYPLTNADGWHLPYRPSLLLGSNLVAADSPLIWNQAPQRTAAKLRHPDRHDPPACRAVT